MKKNILIACLKSAKTKSQGTKKKKKCKGHKVNITQCVDTVSSFYSGPLGRDLVISLPNVIPPLPLLKSKTHVQFHRGDPLGDRVESLQSYEGSGVRWESKWLELSE